MPLAGSGLVLGAAICAAGGILDTAGIAKAGAVAEALADWLVTHTVVLNAPAAPTANLTAAGSAVTGTGRFSFTGSGDDLGEALAAAVPATDEEGILKWKALGNALCNHISKYGQANPTAYVASPTGGAVTGQGTLSFSTSTFDTPLGQVIGVFPDTTGMTVWTALGAAILAHLSANTVVNSLGFTSPSGGGLLVGASIIG